MSRSKQIDWNAAGFEGSLETTDMARQMSVAMMEYGRSLWALQLDTASTMTAETTRQFKDWLQSAAENGDTVGQWPGLFYPRTQQFVQIARGWLNIASQTTTEINELFGQALAATFALTDENLTRYPQYERRTTAQVISFPDRRRSATQSKTPLAGHQADEPQRHRTRTA